MDDESERRSQPARASQRHAKCKPAPLQLTRERARPSDTSLRFVVAVVLEAQVGEGAERGLNTGTLLAIGNAANTPSSSSAPTSHSKERLPSA